MSRIHEHSRTELTLVRLSGELKVSSAHKFPFIERCTVRTMCFLSTRASGNVPIGS